LGNPKNCSKFVTASSARAVAVAAQMNPAAINPAVHPGQIGPTLRRVPRSDGDTSSAGGELAALKNRVTIMSLIPYRQTGL
jgi:hypothetical protein